MTGGRWVRGMRLLQGFSLENPLRRTFLVNGIEAVEDTCFAGPFYQILYQMALECCL